MTNEEKIRQHIHTLFTSKAPNSATDAPCFVIRITNARYPLENEIEVRLVSSYKKSEDTIVGLVQVLGEGIWHTGSYRSTENSIYNMIKQRIKKIEDVYEVTDIITMGERTKKRNLA